MGRFILITLILGISAILVFSGCQSKSGLLDTKSRWNIRRISLSVSEGIGSPFGFNSHSSYTIINQTEPIIEAMNETGAGYYRLWTFWHLIEPEQDNFQFEEKGYDEEVINLVNNDIEIVGVLTRTPCWAAQNPFGCSEWNTKIPANFEDYYHFINRTIERYKPGGILATQQGWDDGQGINFWEIWNEPDLMYKDFREDPGKYAEMLKGAYRIINNTDPEAQVLLGGLSLCSGCETTNTEFLEELYQSDSKNYFDIMSFHYYVENAWRIWSYDDDVHGLFTTIDYVKDTMDKYGDEKPIWNTEGAAGYIDDYNESKENQIMQAQYIPRYFVSQLANGVENVFWFYFIDYWSTEYLGVVKRPSGEPLNESSDVSKLYKLSYYTYKLMTEKLSGSDWNKTETIMENQNNTYIYKFIQDNESIYVAWWDYWDENATEKSILLPVNFTGNALITNAVPNATNGSELNSSQYPEFFETEILPVVDGRVNLTLREDPVFVEEIEKSPSADLITSEFFGQEVVPYGTDLYVELGFPDYVDHLGVGIAGRNQYQWWRFEPEPPVNGVHSYTWDFFDKDMRGFHDADLQIQIVVGPMSEWGTVVNTSEIEWNTQFSPPKEEHWDDWGEFIYQLVERYDGDGYMDAPNITKPVIKIIQIGNEIEVPMHWTDNGGTFENYNQLLNVSYLNAKRADPNILVARAATNPGSAFDDDPSSEEIEEIMSLGQHDEFINKSLDAADYFDLFGIHLNSNYTGIVPFVEWIRDLMQEKGVMKPIYSEDTKVSPPEEEWSEETKEQYMADQASNVVKKLAKALEADLESMIIVPLMDFEGCHTCERWAHAGLFDREIIEETLNLSKAVRPAYFTYQLYISKVKGYYLDIEKIEVGDKIEAFELRNPNGSSLHILWSQGGIRNATIILESDSVLLTHIVTEMDEDNNRNSPIGYW